MLHRASNPANSISGFGLKFVLFYPFLVEFIRGPEGLKRFKAPERNRPTANRCLKNQHQLPTFSERIFHQKTTSLLHGELGILFNAEHVLLRKVLRRREEMPELQPRKINGWQLKRVGF